LAQRLGLNSSLVRFGAAIIILASNGLGLIAYLLAWLLIPSDRQAESAWQQQLQAHQISRRRSRPLLTVFIVVLCLGLLLSAVSGFSWVWIALIVIALAIFLRRRGPRVVYRTQTRSGQPSTPEFDQAMAAWQGRLQQIQQAADQPALGSRLPSSLVESLNLEPEVGGFMPAAQPVEQLAPLVSPTWSASAAAAAVASPLDTPSSGPDSSSPASPEAGWGRTAPTPAHAGPDSFSPASPEAPATPSTFGASADAVAPPAAAPLGATDSYSAGSNPASHPAASDSGQTGSDQANHGGDASPSVTSADRSARPGTGSTGAALSVSFNAGTGDLGLARAGSTSPGSAPVASGYNSAGGPIAGPAAGAAASPSANSLPSASVSASASALSANTPSHGLSLSWDSQTDNPRLSTDLATASPNLVVTAFLPETNSVVAKSTATDVAIKPRPVLMGWLVVISLVAAGAIWAGLVGDFTGADLVPIAATVCGLLGVGLVVSPWTGRPGWLAPTTGGLVAVSSGALLLAHLLHFL
jgi:hypothetical protein